MPRPIFIKMNAPISMQFLNAMAWSAYIDDDYSNYFAELCQARRLCAGPRYIVNSEMKHEYYFVLVYDEGPHQVASPRLPFTPPSSFLHNRCRATIDDATPPFTHMIYSKLHAFDAASVILSFIFIYNIIKRTTAYILLLLVLTLYIIVQPPIACASISINIIYYAKS